MVTLPGDRDPELEVVVVVAEEASKMNRWIDSWNPLTGLRVTSL